MKTKLTQIAAILFVTVCMTSCYQFPMFITGTGPIVTQEFDLPEFDEIDAETVVDVDIVQGDSQKVVVEGNENMMNFIELRVVGGKLHVDLADGSYSNFDLKVYVTVPTVKEIAVESTGSINIEGFTGLKSLIIKSSSTGNITTDGTFEIGGDLEISSSSTGNITVSANCTDLETKISGTGNVSIEGNCHMQNVSLSGTGKYYAFLLLSEDCDLVSSGTGDALINVSEQLDVAIRSVGSVYYKGNPRINVQDSSIGSLIHSN